MSRKVKIALIQQHASEEKSENISRAIAAYETAASQGANVIAFAELAFSYFYPQKPAQGDISLLAESIPGPTTEIFCDLAKKWDAVTIINLFEIHESKTYDSSPIIDADGKILGVTRMAHIMEGPCFHEQGYYSPGNSISPVFATQFGKIGVAICYDRHFPEYMRALKLKGAEIVIVPQAGAIGEWPPGLFEAELQVASFQNGYFSALCNRVGKEDCVEFEGKSFITAPDGRVIAQAPAGKDFILLHEIDLDEIKNCHAERHFLKDRRPEIYHNFFRQ